MVYITNINILCVCLVGHTRIRTELTNTPCTVDLRVVGSQTFYFSAAFNVNIGAWNTARVANLDHVCACTRICTRLRGCARDYF